MEEVETKWLMQLLLDVQTFAQGLKELSIKNMARFFCFSIVPQPCFIPEWPGNFLGSPLREEPLLMRTVCSETEKKKKPNMFKFRLGFFGSC